MSISPLRFRQVHLDFHTSPSIEGIGARFDPDEFAETLARAHVNSVTCFARCHHGWIYYDSKINPERIHPHLVNKNLLPEQIAACHKRDIRVPIYITVQWDDYTADRHRDWLLVNEQGELYPTKPLTAGFYRNLDVFHSGYRQFLKDHVAEVFRAMPVDGIFFDIVGPRPSLARHWLDAMDEAGLNPEDPAQRMFFTHHVIDTWKREMTAFVKAQPGYRPDCTIFYNGGHIGPNHRRTHDAYTHYELESLPSGGWGYLHFPVTQRYVRGFNKETLGMTGKFHTSWGDFHSFKNRAALQFECFHMLALGAKCSIGDQLHPSGKIDHVTYSLIGEIYAEVEQKEPWCSDVKALSEVCVFTPEEFGDGGKYVVAQSRIPETIMGAVRMLQEAQIQFDIVSSERDISHYKLAILPDEIPVNAALADKLERFVASGGALILNHRSGLDETGSAFALPSAGIEYIGDAPFSPDFLIPGAALRNQSGLTDTGYAMYLKGTQVAPVYGTQILAQVERPYFNRTWRHFCSHRHTPSSGEISYGGIFQNGRVIYFMHPIFKQYHQNAPSWCRKLLKAAITHLIGTPLLATDGPTTLIASLNRQQALGRDVLHLLHYIPERRGKDFDIVEDIIPLKDINVSLRSDRKFESVKVVPLGQAIQFASTDHGIAFTIPEIKGHCMIELKYR